MYERMTFLRWQESNCPASVVGVHLIRLLSTTAYYELRSYITDGRSSTRSEKSVAPKAPRLRGDACISGLGTGFSELNAVGFRYSRSRHCQKWLFAPHLKRHFPTRRDLLQECDLGDVSERATSGDWTARPSHAVRREAVSDWLVLAFLGVYGRSG